MRTNKRYNPNTFNAVHAVSAYFAFLALSFVLTILFSALSKTWGQESASKLLCMKTAALSAGTLLIALVVCLIAKTNPVNGGGFLVRKGCGVEMLMAGVLACGASAAFAPLAEIIFMKETEIRCFFGISAGGELPSDSWLALYLLIFVPLLPAVCEELLFRGIVMRGFLQFGKVPAVVLSSLMFALAGGQVGLFAHEEVLYRFFFGLIVGALVLETKNPAVGVAAHFANNFFGSWGSFAYVFAFGRSGKEMYIAVIDLMTCLIGAVCLVAGIIYFGKRMIHSVKAGEKSRGDIAATFVVNDMVAGTLLEEKSWYDCGALAERNAEPQGWLCGKTGRAKLNRRSGGVLSAVLAGVGILLGATLKIILFFGVI